MPDNDILQTVNNFGCRLNSMELRHADCAGRTDQRLKQVEADCADKGDQITRIFQAQEATAVAMAEIKSTIRVWGVVISVASPVVASIVAAVIGRLM